MGTTASSFLGDESEGTLPTTPRAIDNSNIGNSTERRGSSSDRSASSKVRPATIFDIGSSVSDKKVSRNHSKPADRGSSLGDTGSSRQVTVSTNVVEEPPPQTLREELEQEAAEGLDTLSDQELAAWVCRGNNVLDSSIIQRARRIFRTRLRLEPPSAPFSSPFGAPTPCPSPEIVDRAHFEWFISPSEIRKAPRANFEYWETAPEAHWRDAITKKPIMKKLALKRESEFRSKHLKQDEDTAGTPEHALRLRSGGVSASWLLAITLRLDLWEWPTWEVASYLVKTVTEYRGRARFSDLPEVRPYTGLATIYVCHCWGGRWGDLVAACVTGARDDRFLFLDLFAIRQWPGNNADMDYREVIRQCDSVLVVAPPLPLLVPPLCPKGHVLPQEVDNDDDDEAVTTATTSPTMPTSNISSSNAVPAYVARKLAAAPSGSVPEKGVKSSSLQNTSSQKGEEVKDSISTDETTVVENESRCSECGIGLGKHIEPGAGWTEHYCTCTECNKNDEKWVACAACLAQRQEAESSTWFARDPVKRRAFLDSDAYAEALEMSPFLRLWCLVEMATALEFGKPVVFKVGTYKVQGIEEARKSKLDAIAQKRATKEIEKAAKKATAQAKAVSSKDESGAAASEEGEESVEKPNGSGKKKKRSMNPMKNIFKTLVGDGDGAWEHGMVSLEAPSPKELATFMLNCSSLIDVMNAAYSMPDDYEREMLRLKERDEGNSGEESAAEVLNDAVSTALYAAAFEQPLPEVDAYLLGERSALRALPQPKVYKAFEAAASGGRIDVMCELLCVRPEDVGHLGYHLCKASMKGHLGAMDMLLSYGAKINEVAFGNTPLGCAVESGQIDAISLLLGRGANVNKDPGGRGTPLWCAASGGHLSIVKLLLAAGADRNLSTLGQTPLMAAEDGARLGRADTAETRDFEAIVKLLKKPKPAV